VPGSHLTNWIDGPPRRDITWPDPEGAIEVTAEPGDVLFFDRRIWHARSRNYSEHTRKAVFFGYTYRWTAIRDDIASTRASDWFGQLTPVQQQLLGGIEDANGDHAWGHYPEATPLYGWLKERGPETCTNPKCLTHEDLRSVLHGGALAGPGRRPLGAADRPGAAQPGAVPVLRPARRAAGHRHQPAGRPAYSASCACATPSLPRAR
jgi:hypothetical protein